MTRYMDKDRRDWRARLHRLVRRYRHLSLSKVAVLLLLLALLAPGVAQAGTVRCTWPMQPGFYRVTVNGVVRVVGVCYMYRPEGVLP